MDRAPVPNLKYQPVEGSIPSQGRKKVENNNNGKNNNNYRNNNNNNKPNSLGDSGEKKEIELPKNWIDGATRNFLQFFPQHGGPFLQEQKKTSKKNTFGNQLLGEFIRQKN